MLRNGLKVWRQKQEGCSLLSEQQQTRRYHTQPRPGAPGPGSPCSARSCPAHPVRQTCSTTTMVTCQPGKSYQTTSTWHQQQLRILISLCLRHPLEFHRILSGGIPSGTSLRLVSAEVPGRSSSHLSVCRERDEDTVTSSTLQEPSSGATMSEARGPRSGPAHMQTQRHQHSRCVRATALRIISPAPLGAAKWL